MSDPQTGYEAPPSRFIVSNLEKQFASNGSAAVVLDDISFDVADAEFVCIAGKSGCGKSTLLKILAGFEPPSSGKLVLDGHAVSGPGPTRCFVFQEDALFPWLTVGENIGFGLKQQGISGRQIDKEVDRFLHLVGLSEYKSYLPREISGGMKQRVALARVLILNPGVLLMDEPFASLDAQTRHEMQGLLLKLWKELGHIILFVTHDLTEALTLADRIIVMDDQAGCIKEIVTVDLPRPRQRDNPDFMGRYRRLNQLLFGGSDPF